MTDSKNVIMGGISGRETVWGHSGSPEGGGGGAICHALQKSFQFYIALPGRAAVTEG
jgi:hypothetical protein